VTRVLDIADPARGRDRLRGRLLGSSVSVIVINAPPGGARSCTGIFSRRVFVVQEGIATLTAGEETIV